MERKKQNNRDSNIEVCRIICMLMIIAHHCVAHGGAAGMEPCTNKYIAWLILPGGKFCFDTFLAISAWFLVDKTFKTERFLKVWGTVLFYSLLFSIVSATMGVVFSWRNWVSMLFPITGNSHGFAASYLAFYLLIPFLTMISKKVTKKQAKWLVVILLYFQVISQIVGTVSGYFQPITSELLLFVLCYFIALYLKRYPISLFHNRIFLGSLLLVIWIIVFGIYYWNITSLEESVLRSILLSLCKDESSVLYLVGGYALFFLFNSIKMPKCEIINKVAGTTFGVLLMHDHNFFRPILWNNILHTSEWWYSEFFIAKLSVCVILIFVVGMIIDMARQRFLERPVFSIKQLQRFTVKMDEMLNEP